MEWKKLGQIFNVSGKYHWMNSHAANPVPFVLDEVDEIVRVFFTCRTTQNISYIGYVDIDFKRNFKILGISKQPVISPGSPGLFDDSGTAMGQIIEHENKYFLFYLGWNLKVTVPWLNTIGLAISESINGPFIKVSLAPVMDRSGEDPFSISYPSILKDGNIFVNIAPITQKTSVESAKCYFEMMFARQAARVISQQGDHYTRELELKIRLSLGL